MKRVIVAALAVMGMATLPTDVEAGHGNAVGAGLLGFGVGAIVGSALTPREVYIAPPPPPPMSITLRWAMYRHHGARMVQLLSKHLRPVIQSEYGLFSGRKWWLVFLPIGAFLSESFNWASP